jgi:hypothetical protein
VAPGGVLEILVKLRLPLTPPPGVQQPKANEGWRVTLVKRDVLTLSGEPTTASYEHPLMRLRPVKRDVYRLFVELYPWLLEGAYDLEVVGPGFHASRPGALRVGGASTAVPPPVVRAVGHRTLAVENSSPGPRRAHFNLLLPGDVAGIAVTRDGAPIFPGRVVLASVRGNSEKRDRVLSFSIEMRGAKGEASSNTVIKWTTTPARPCDAVISWLDADRRRETMAWRDLALNAKTPPTTVIWDFGDGRWGEGQKVRYRWLLTSRAEVTAWVFDRSGGMCEVHSAAELSALDAAAGCGCRLPAQKSDVAPFIGAIFLFSGWIAE